MPETVNDEGARNVAEAEAARVERSRQAKVYPNSVDVAVLNVTVNGILVRGHLREAGRDDQDLSAIGLGTDTLGGMLADTAQRATAKPDNPLLYESTVASRLGGAPRRVVIEQIGSIAARMDYPTE